MRILPGLAFPAGVMETVHADCCEGGQCLRGVLGALMRLFRFCDSLV